jgi:hypothetical protein
MKAGRLLVSLAVIVLVAGQAVAYAYEDNGYDPADREKRLPGRSKDDAPGLDPQR